MPKTSLSSLPEEYKKIIYMIQEAETHGMLPAGIMFYGPKETAKNIIASELSRVLLKKESNSIHPDELILEPEQGASAISIEAVREFISSFSSSPLVASRRVGIIRAGDMLTIQSQNALLKTLEEPPQHSCMILIVDDLTKILPTITSRLTKIFLPTLSKDAYMSYFEKQRIRLPEKDLLPYCFGRIERTMFMQDKDNQHLALFAKELYQKIYTHPFSIFTYTQKNKSTNQYSIEECFPYLIHYAHQNLAKNNQDFFSRRFLSTLLPFVRHSLNRNPLLTVENVCIQN
jgi:hypothetical protein